MNKGINYYQSNQGVESLTILQRIAETDKSAVAECLDRYGNLVWMAAKTYTDSPEEAEEVVIKIFRDIWKNASQYDTTKGSEEKYILLVVFRYLIKYRSTNAKHFYYVKSAH